MRTSLALLALLLSAAESRPRKRAPPPPVAEEARGLPFRRRDQGRLPLVPGAGVGDPVAVVPGGRPHAHAGRREARIEIQHLAMTGEGDRHLGRLREVRSPFPRPVQPQSHFDRRQGVRAPGLRAIRRQAGTAERSRRARMPTLLFGMAPRFSKQTTRRLETYGLVGHRGREIRAAAARDRGFVRRSRLRAGHGRVREPSVPPRHECARGRQPLRWTSAEPDATYESDFPILYDAKVSEVNVTGHLEKGFGLGARLGRRREGGRRRPRLVLRASPGRDRATQGARTGRESCVCSATRTSPFKASGDQRHEWGVNLQAQGERAQRSSDSGWTRIWPEPAATVWRPKSPGSFPSPASSWWASRRSETGFNPRSVIHGSTTGSPPRINYPRLSVAWPWKKYDFGLRFGLVRNVDLTAEYTFHQIFRTASLPNLPMKEFVLTLRTGF